MTTKKCKKCGNILPIEQFPFHNRRLNTHVAYCVECFKEKRKERRLSNKERYKEVNHNSYIKHREKRLKKVSEYQKDPKNKVNLYKLSQKTRKKNTDEFKAYKSTLVCTNCGENHPACLEFHHIDPSTKEGLVAKMIHTRLKLEKELKKCIVLCSNCHRKLHYNDKPIT